MSKNPLFRNGKENEVVIRNPHADPCLSSLVDVCFRVCHRMRHRTTEWSHNFRLVGVGNNIINNNENIITQWEAGHASWLTLCYTRGVVNTMDQHYACQPSLHWKSQIAHSDMICLWNQLPDSFRQPRQSCLDSPPHSAVSSSLLSSPLSSSITPSLFHSRLKTYLFNKSFPP